MKKVTTVLTGLALAAGIGGCGGGGDGGSDGGTITIATVASDSGAQGFLGDEKGFFEAEGLDVDVQIVAGVPELAAAVQSDRADFALTSPTSIASATASGLPCRVVAAGVLYTEEKPGTWLTAATQTDIDSVEDLAGKSIAVNALNTLPHLSTMATLDDAGVDVSTVEFVTLDFPSIGQALESGQVPAGAVVSPYVNQQETAGIAQRLVSPYDAVNDRQEFLNTVWFAKEDYIAEHPDVVEKFRAALGETSAWANEPANVEERKAILQEYTDLADRALGALELSSYGDEVTPELLQPLLDLMHRFGALEEPMDAESIIGEGVH